MPGGMKTSFWNEIGAPATFADFLNPAKVAQHIMSRLDEQIGSFYEEVIERGSL